MKRSTRAMRLLAGLGGLLVLGMGAWPVGLVHAAGPSPAPSRYFAATRHTVSGRFLAAWQAGHADADSLRLDGLPLSEPHDEISLTDGKVYQVQWFERARFELHPEHASPFDVERGLLGSFAAEGRTDPPFQPVPNPSGGQTWFPQTRHTLGDATTGGQMLAGFWRANGGLGQFGYPLSQPFLEESAETDPQTAGKVFLVQYFERQRLEYHPENAGTPFVVLLGRLGAVQEALGPAPEPLLARGTASVDTLHIAAPDGVPDRLLPYFFPFNFPQMVFNRLVDDDPQYNLHPDLALYVPTLQNGGAVYVGSGDDKHLEVKFKLKHGVKWYDGVEFTSADVLFTYDLESDPAVNAIDVYSVGPDIAAVTAPDPYTVVFRYDSWREAAQLLAADPDANGYLRSYVERHLPVLPADYNVPLDYIVPQHVLAGVAPADVENTAYAQRPWGTGPYYVTQNDPGKRIELAVNPNFSVTPNRPLVAHIVVDAAYALADASHYIASLATSADPVIIPQVPVDALRAAQALVATGRYRWVELPTGTYEVVTFNVQMEPFNDLRLRQAMAYALDRRSVAHLLADAWPPMRSWVPASNWASLDNPDNQDLYPLLAAQTPRYDYDPAMANRLLDAAGWTARDPQGIRMKDGVRLSIKWLTTNNRPYRRATATLAQQQLRAVGVEAVPDLLPNGAFFASPDGPLWTGKYGDYGVAQFAWLALNGDPLGNEYLTSNIPTAANGFNGNNMSRWSNAESDRLLADAWVNFGRGPQRLEDYLHQQAIFLQELPALPLVALPTVVLVPSAMQNVSGSGDYGLQNVQDWYLPKH